MNFILKLTFALTVALVTPSSVKGQITLPKAIHLKYSWGAESKSYEEYYLLLGAKEDIGGIAVRVSKSKDGDWTVRRGFYRKGKDYVSGGGGQYRKSHPNTKVIAYDMTFHGHDVCGIDIDFWKSSASRIGFEILNYQYDTVREGIISSNGKLAALPQAVETDVLKALVDAIDDLIEHDYKMKREPDSWNVLPVGAKQVARFKNMQSAIRRILNGSK